LAVCFAARFGTFERRIECELRDKPDVQSCEPYGRTDDEPIDVRKARVEVRLRYEQGSLLSDHEHRTRKDDERGEDEESDAEILTCV
jgi:hypothetical protein